MKVKWNRKWDVYTKFDRKQGLCPHCNRACKQINIWKEMAIIQGIYYPPYMWEIINIPSNPGDAPLAIGCNKTLRAAKRASLKAAKGKEE